MSWSPLGWSPLSGGTKDPKVQAFLLSIMPAAALDIVEKLLALLLQQAVVASVLALAPKGWCLAWVQVALVHGSCRQQRLCAIQLGLDDQSRPRKGNYAESAKSALLTCSVPPASGHRKAGAQPGCRLLMSMVAAASNASASCAPCIGARTR